MQYAFASAHEALEGSRLDIDAEADRVGIVMATALNGTAEIAETERAYSVDGKKKVSPRFLPKILGNLGAAQIAIQMCIRDSITAMTSTSQRASFGRVFTATHDLAGFSVKYFSYTLLNSPKSPISARKHMVLTTFSCFVPASASTCLLYTSRCV